MGRLCIVLRRTEPLASEYLESRLQPNVIEMTESIHRTLHAPLRGPRVTLRVPGPEELPFIHRLWTDAATMAAVGGPVEVTLAQLEGWYARMVDPGRGTDLFTLIFDENDEPIGECGFHRLDWDSMQADFNVKVLANKRGQGYGGEAVRLLLEYFFAELGGQLMIDDLALDNPAGQQAMRRLGFLHDPEPMDCCRLFMTRDRYFELQIRP